MQVSLPRKPQISRYRSRPLPREPKDSARLIGLRYVSDREPGIVRRPSGRGFRYFDPAGARVTDRAILERIRRLVIPPAWTDVWICVREDGHLQTVGRDAKGRKQYRYHPAYRQIRDQTKFDRMSSFGAALPAIRARVRKDLSTRGMSREKILAAIVELLDSAAFRIGGEEYTRQNDSFGLTTLRNHHVEVDGQTIHFHFRGKSGQFHKMKLTNRRLAAVVRKCQCLPGQDLFLYQDETGEPVKVHSEDVNHYLDTLTNDKFTAKDFRTWRGTSEMIVALQQLGPPADESEAKKMITEAVKLTAQKLGNRPATCRAYYIHPAVPEAYLKGTLFDTLDRSAKIEATESGLRPEERCALELASAPEHRLTGK
jgi:DNA topoisomerase I